MADLDVRLSPRFLACLRKLTDAQVRRVDKALHETARSLGNPHAHSGLSIRRLHEDIFECRAGTELRLLFQLSAGSVDFFFAGDHAAVKRLIRELR